MADAVPETFVISPSYPASMLERDRTVQRDLLEFVYAEFAKDPHVILMTDGLPEELGFSEQDVRYNARRMADDGLIDLEHDSVIRPTAKGIEWVHEAGEKTFLDGEERYKILESMYAGERASTNGAYYDREELARDTGFDQLLVDINVRYLTWKGLLDTSLFIGGGYHTRITQAGAKAWEAYHDRGVTIPGGHDTRMMRQRTIGPNERAKSAKLFRDIVELSSRELVIIDPYARAPIFSEIVSHVPKQVQVLILTTDRAIDKDHAKELASARATHKVDVRVLPNTPADWPFHDRYVIRDAEYGWTWGSSFHDSGEKQHTATELRPVNMNKILGDFKAAWLRAKAI